MRTHPLALDVAYIALCVVASLAGTWAVDEFTAEGADYLSRLAVAAGPASVIALVGIALIRRLERKHRGPQR